MSTLADDEAMFLELSEDLLGRVLEAAPAWIRSCFGRYGVEDADLVAATLAAWQDDVGQELDVLFHDDVDAQRINPLAVLRRGVTHLTRSLAAAGVTPPVRERFAVDSFPDDLYDLSPASFADFHPDLAEPGLVWGAAKAHVHLRRRREAGTSDL